MTDTTEAKTRQTKEYAQFSAEGETYLIVDRTRHTQNIEEVNGPFGAAESAALTRAAVVKDGRDVFIFKKVAVCSNRPTVTPIDTQHEKNETNLSKLIPDDTPASADQGSGDDTAPF